MMKKIPKRGILLLKIAWHQAVTRDPFADASGGGRVQHDCPRRNSAWRKQRPLHHDYLTPLILQRKQ